MTISIKCPSCSKTLKAPAEMAGKKARCPNCKTPVLIPAPKVKEEPIKLDNELPLAPLDPLFASPSPSASPGASSLGDPLAGLDPLGINAPVNPLFNNVDWSAPAAAPASAATPAGRVNYIVPAEKPTAGRRYWFFCLALLPLAFSLLLPERGREELARSLDSLPDANVGADSLGPGAFANEPEGTPIGDTTGDPSPEAVSDAAMDEDLADADEENWDDEEFSDEEDSYVPELSPEDMTKLLRVLPGNKLPGAHLSRGTWVHWLYALVAAGLFFGLIIALFQQGQATPKHLFWVGVLTATCGVISLIIFQWFAAISTFMSIRGGGIMGIFMLFVKLIGFSYAAAMDPNNGFLLSLLGFTFGVGLCEEFIKAIPIIGRYRNEDPLDWRGACAWGLASGVGFGVAEGIFYSSDYYNGIAGPGIYVVRFISCVALHAIWTASVGILLWRHKEAVTGQMEWGDWALALAKVQGVVMLLHGLYDTLLKREMNALALVVAAASFGWLVWLMHQSLTSEERSPVRVTA